MHEMNPLDCIEAYPDVPKEDSRIFLCYCKNTATALHFEKPTVWSRWALRVYDSSAPHISCMELLGMRKQSLF